MRISSDCIYDGSSAANNTALAPPAFPLLSGGQVKR
jgi:hypothetical protein